MRGHRVVLAPMVCRRQTWSEEEPINIGTGADITIAALARVIADIVGYKGVCLRCRENRTGLPQAARRLQTEGTRLVPASDPEAGIRQTYEWYRTSRAERQ
jgi:GDP-L-fucose synthase